VCIKSPTTLAAGQSRAWRTGPPVPAPHAVRVTFVGMAALEIAACRRLCSWSGTEELLDGQRLFRCAGCGSEWVRTEPWTPIDHTGEVPDAVQEERRRGRG
jgi:hypothetical protein